MPQSYLFRMETETPQPAMACVDGALAEAQAGDAVVDVPAEPLTRRERDVLALLARGWSNQRIGRSRYISENTVKFHVKNIYRKLNVRGRGEAVWVALNRKLVTL